MDVLPFPASFASSLPAALLPELGGNAGDEAELAGDLVLTAIAAHLRQPIAFDGDGRPSAPFDERLEAWLEDSDDAFLLTLEPEIPDELVSFVRLFLDDAEWARTQARGKMPKPVPSEDALAVIDAAIAARLGRYAHPGLEEDAQVLKEAERGSNAYNAAAVRLGEKRCLLLAQSRVAEMKREMKKRRIAERKEQREAKRRR